MREFLRHFFLPHESNDHRPKLLHHESLFTLILFFLSFTLFLSSIKTDFPSVLGLKYDITVNELVKMTNEKRAQNGLPPLKLNESLSKAALLKGKDMMEKNYWAHISPQGTTPWVFIRNSGYEYLYAGENLARGFTTTEDAVDAWMASPSHRENILSDHYDDIGFAVIEGNLRGSETVLVVEMFGSKYIAANGEPAPTIIAANPTPVPLTVEDSTDQNYSLDVVSPDSQIAAYQNKPLVDSRTFPKDIAFIILIVIIGVLILDAIIIKRKKIARLVSHNLDHIILLSILLLAAIILGKGVIL